MQEPGCHVQLYRLCTAQVKGIPARNQWEWHSLWLWSCTTGLGRGEKAFLKEGTGSKDGGQEPLNFTRTASKLPSLKCFMFCILPPPPPPWAATVHHGAFSGLLSSYDECSLIACIDSPSEALAWLLINPPSGCSVLSGHSAPYLLVQFNELVAKSCWCKIHIYWIWLSRACPCMSNLLVLVAGTTLDHCVTVLLMGSPFAHFFGQKVTVPTTTNPCWLGTEGFPLLLFPPHPTLVSSHTCHLWPYPMQHSPFLRPTNIRKSLASVKWCSLYFSA